MPFEQIPLQLVAINRANDRHGELENETAAIAELFRLREDHMKKLAADIVAEGAIYDAPLVSPENGRFLVFDGNRRLTCLKLIAEPGRAPNQELQAYFTNLRDQWEGDLPAQVICQVENDRDTIDAILFRRHTGSQGGVGQSNWDDRAKRNFVERTGRGGRVNVADEVEAILAESNRLPERIIPRSTLNRLLSSEPNRERVGISVQGNRFRITHNRNLVVDALARIADDLAHRRVVLGDLWDNHGKLAYFNRLEGEGALPAENARLPGETPPEPRHRRGARRGRPPVRAVQVSFIPLDAPVIPWRADQARARAVWEELQGIRLDHYPNAVSAMMRILVDLTVESYLANWNLKLADNLSRRFGDVASDLLQRDIIDRNYFDEIERLRRHDELISIRSMQRYIHSNSFAPMHRELTTYWSRLGKFIVAALSH